MDKVVETVDSRLIAVAVAVAMSVRHGVARVSMDRMAEANPEAVTIPDLPATFDVADNTASPVLLDVREQDEWDRGHAPDARHLPMGDALQELANTGAIAGIEKGADLYVVCHAGGRSMKVATALLDSGYAPRNVTGGMSSWAAAGRTVVNKDETAGSV